MHAAGVEEQPAHAHEHEPVGEIATLEQLARKYPDNPRVPDALLVLGNAQARVYVSAVKAMVPEKVCQIIDQAIQIHGATGVSQWTPLAGMYASQRTLRLADGPDEVHHFVVARHEAGQYSEPAPGRAEAGGTGVFAGP